MTQQARKACDSSELESLLSCKLLKHLLSVVQIEHATQQGECVQMRVVFCEHSRRYKASGAYAGCKVLDLLSIQQASMLLWARLHLLGSAKLD